MRGLNLTENEIKIYELSMKGLNMKDIASKLGFTQPYISQVLRNLEQKREGAKEILKILKSESQKEVRGR